MARRKFLTSGPNQPRRTLHCFTTIRWSSDDDGNRMTPSPPPSTTATTTTIEMAAVASSVATIIVATDATTKIIATTISLLNFITNCYCHHLIASHGRNQPKEHRNVTITYFESPLYTTPIYTSSSTSPTNTTTTTNPTPTHIFVTTDHSRSIPDIHDFDLNKVGDTELHGYEIDIGRYFVNELS